MVLKAVEMNVFAQKTRVPFRYAKLTGALYIRWSALVRWQVNQDGGHAVKRFPPAETLILRQLTQEGGQDDKDFCPLRPKLWTNTVPRDKSQ